MKRLAVTLGALLAAACGIDFDTPTEVTDLRTLAVQAEPPEVLVASPDDLPAVTLRALVVDPRDPERAVTASWQACGTTTDHRCAQAPYALDLGEGAATLPILEGRLSMTRELLESAQSLDVLQGFGGLPVTVELRVDAGEGGAEVSIKQVVVQAFLPEGTAPNQNPSPPALRRDDADWPEDEIPTVAPEAEIAVEPRAAPADAETYAVFRFDLSVQELEEFLSFRFFATAGAWNRAESGGTPDGISTETTLASRWTAPAEPPSDGAPVRLWVVVRDGRGGVAWTTRQVRVE